MVLTRRQSHVSKERQPCKAAVRRAVRRPPAISCCDGRRRDGDRGRGVDPARGRRLHHHQRTRPGARSSSCWPHDQYRADDPREPDQRDHHQVVALLRGRLRDPPPPNRRAIGRNNPRQRPHHGRASSSMPVSRNWSSGSATPSISMRADAIAVVDQLPGERSPPLRRSSCDPTSRSWSSTSRRSPRPVTSPAWPLGGVPGA